MALNPTKVLMNAYNAFLDRAQNVRASYNAAKFIDVDHERTHAGRLFSYTQINSADASGGTFDFLIIPDSGEDVHLRKISFRADGGPGIVKVYRDVGFDINSAGVDVSSVWHNANHRSSNALPVSSYKNPYIDVGSLGEEIYSDVLNTSGVGASQASEGDLLIHEMMLNSTINYLIRLTNNDTNPVSVSAKVSAYDAKE